MIKQGDIINIQFDGECNDYGDFIYNYFNCPVCHIKGSSIRLDEDIFNFYLDKHINEEFKCNNCESTFKLLDYNDHTDKGSIEVIKVNVNER